MIHPRFENIPDAKTEQAVREIIYKPDRFTFYLIQGTNEPDLDSTIEQPLLTNVIAAYPDGLGYKWVHAGDDEQRADLQRVNEMYPRHIDDLQDVELQELLNFTKFIKGFKTLDEMKELYIKRVSRKGYAALAAYITLKMVDCDDLIGAVVLPKVINQEIPLYIREDVVSALPRINEFVELLPEDEVKYFRKSIKSILSNSGEEINQGLILATSFLPTSNELKESYLFWS